MSKKTFPFLAGNVLLVGTLLLAGCSEVEQKVDKTTDTSEQQKIDKTNDVSEQQDATEKEPEKETVKEPEETKETSESNIKACGKDTSEGASHNSSGERDAGGYIIGKETPKYETCVNGILIANKVFPMPKTFTPGESAEARQAFNELNAIAKKAGFEFDAFSTYRSYDRQVELYNNYVNRDGADAADRYSARPGFSEHQTGLAFDIGEVGNPGDYADDRFGETKAGKWLAKHAHEAGFIMRYPQGKEKVTGYQYESWHFRYVGKKIATEIYNNNSTLEEYLGVKG